MVSKDDRSSLWRLHSRPTQTQELGRRFLGWEQDCDTYDKASTRIKEAGKQKPLFAPKAAQATQLQLGG